MTSRDMLFCGIGAVIGSVATYFVMDYLFEKELDEIYGEMDDAAGKRVDILVENNAEITENIIVAQHTAAEMKNKADRIINDLYKRKNIEGAERITTDAPEELEFSEEVFVNEENFMEHEDLEDEDSEEEVDEMPVSQNIYDGIFIIPSDQVSDRIVVGEYNHDNGSVVISTSMSTASDDFDDVIENDALYSIVNEEAYDTLMNADPLEPGQGARILAVRNNVINLDFVITY
jgi:hypothetical protein